MSKLWVRRLSLFGILFLNGLVWAGPEPRSTVPDSSSLVRYDEYGRPNLCVIPEQILFGVVENVEAEWFELGRYPLIRSVVTLRVERSVQGWPEGKQFKLRLRGGELDGVVEESYDPRMIVDERYLLFLTEIQGQDFPAKLGFFRVPNSIVGELPKSEQLLRVWNATCERHPEGIYFRGQRIQVVVPIDLWFEGLAEHKVNDNQPVFEEPKKRRD